MAAAAFDRVLVGLAYVARHRGLDVVAGVPALGGLIYAGIYGTVSYLLSSPAFQWTLMIAPGPPRWAPFMWAAWFTIGAVRLAVAAWRGNYASASVGCSWVGAGFVLISIGHVVTFGQRPAPTGVAAYLLLALLCGVLSLLYALLVRFPARAGQR